MMGLKQPPAQAARFQDTRKIPKGVIIMRRNWRRHTRRDQIWLAALLVLIVIGIISNPRPLIIPLLLVGIIALLYFYPPHRWRYWFVRLRSGSIPQARPRKPGKKPQRKVKLRVIEGSKKDDQNEPPRYH